MGKGKSLTDPSTTWSSWRKRHVPTPLRYVRACSPLRLEWPRVVLDGPSLRRSYLAGYAVRIRTYGHGKRPYLVGYPDSLHTIDGLTPSPALISTAFLQGKSLASVTVVGNPDCSDSELEARVRSHLAEWFDSDTEKDGSERTAAAGGSGLPTRGAHVAKWKHLRTYRVPYAQPAQTPPVRDGGFYGRKVQV